MHLSARNSCPVLLAHSEVSTISLKVIPQGCVDELNFVVMDFDARAEDCLNRMYVPNYLIPPNICDRNVRRMHSEENRNLRYIERPHA